MPRGRIHIGTSGWHYGHWVGPFYAEGMTSTGFLDFYAQRFRTVEINNTFYSLPRKATLEGWRDGTPKDFVFACKASRFITHMKKLRVPKRSVKRFVDTIDVLGPKLGPVLFQLPPRWHVNQSRLQGFLEALPERYRYAFELRDETWFTDGVLESLERARAAFCIYDLAGRQSPEHVTTDLVYIRLHGPGQAYQGRYSDVALGRWARNIVTCGQGKGGKSIVTSITTRTPTRHGMGLASPGSWRSGCGRPSPRHDPPEAGSRVKPRSSAAIVVSSSGHAIWNLRLLAR